MTKNHCDKVKALRLKALQVALSVLPDTEFTAIDYQLDDICRDLLGLPLRPARGLPYVRWLTPPSPEDRLPSEVSYAGIEFIKRWEGCRTQAYTCPAGVWTVGYGHTKTTRPGQIVTVAEAEQLLDEDLKVFERAVCRLVKVKLNQNQFDALVSFVFNCGIGAFKQSTLLGELNEGNYREAANQFLRWVYAGKRKLNGLVARRAQEKEMFES